LRPSSGLKSKPSKQWATRVLVFCLANSSTMKMKAERPSEIYENFYRTIRCHIPDVTLHGHSRVNPKIRKVIMYTKGGLHIIPVIHPPEGIASRGGN
jgi:hypothetical protein